MDGDDPMMFIERIVLEIVDRRRFWFHQWRVCRIEKFNIGGFNAREATYAFLKEYDGEPFIKSQKLTVWYNNQKLYLCVRDLIYGDMNRNSNSMVEFIYRRDMFSEIKWPAVTVNRTTRVRWASDYEDMSMLNTSMNVPETQIDGDCYSIDVDEITNTSNQIVPCISCNNVDEDQSVFVKSTPGNITKPVCRECRVRRSVYDLQKLITSDGRTLTLGDITGNQNHFRSSIYIHVTEI